MPLFIADNIGNRKRLFVSFRPTAPVAIAYVGNPITTEHRGPFISVVGRMTMKPQSSYDIEDCEKIWNAVICQRHVIVAISLRVVVMM